jgi:hypothetical protein
MGSGGPLGARFRLRIEARMDQPAGSAVCRALRENGIWLLTTTTRAVRAAGPGMDWGERPALGRRRIHGLSSSRCGYGESGPENTKAASADGWDAALGSEWVQTTHTAGKARDNTRNNSQLDGTEHPYRDYTRIRIRGQRVALFRSSAHRALTLDSSSPCHDPCLALGFGSWRFLFVRHAQVADRRARNHTGG